MEEVGYKKLIVWQKADELGYRIYLATRNFPKEEMYGITSQLRRAALSVPTNIVEGYGRQSKGELKRFLNIALGSIAETEYLLDFSLRLKYLSKENHNELRSLRQEVGGLLWKFYRSIW
jgi:four helix bundle protein